MTNAIARVSVVPSMSEGGLDEMASKPAAQQLREILNGEQQQPFEGSGCSDHVRRRDMKLPILAAIALLVVLVVLLVI